jgi:prephenate dehydrogenase
VLESDLLVVGAGLIGTSVGLAAAAAGWQVAITDSDPRRAEVAAAMGAGTAVAGPLPAAGLAVVAVPPAEVARVALDLLGRLRDTTVTHVASVQSAPAVEVEAWAGEDVQRFVGGHPIAGREVSGPTAASADLFADRPWVVCPVAASSPAAVDAVLRLVRTCRAEPVVLPAVEHDELLARLSHAPQVVASALAATLTGLGGEAARLAGSGLRDTTRLADSDPGMWGQVAAANAAALAAALRAVAAPLADLAERLERDPVTAGAAVHDLVARGRAGRALLPGKHGRPAVPLASVQCVVPDSPGALARLFGDIADEAVNVEDLRVEHAPGQPVGFAEVAVAPRDKERLVTGLRRRGWVVTEGGDEAL